MSSLFPEACLASPQDNNAGHKAGMDPGNATRGSRNAHRALSADPDGLGRRTYLLARLLPVGQSPDESVVDVGAWKRRAVLQRPLCLRPTSIVVRDAERLAGEVQARTVKECRSLSAGASATRRNADRLRSFARDEFGGAAVRAVADQRWGEMVALQPPASSHST